MSPVAANLVSGRCVLTQCRSTRISQVNYGYHLSGVNTPPFGCLETGTITPALCIRFGSLNLVTLLNSDPVQT